jgi:hypothetical protein
MALFMREFSLLRREHICVRTVGSAALQQARVAIPDVDGRLRVCELRSNLVGSAARFVYSVGAVIMSPNNLRYYSNSYGLRYFLDADLAAVVLLPTPRRR